MTEHGSLCWESHIDRTVIQKGIRPKRRNKLEIHSKSVMLDMDGTECTAICFAMDIAVVFMGWYLPPKD